MCRVSRILSAIALVTVWSLRAFAAGPVGPDIRVTEGRPVFTFDNAPRVSTDAAGNFVVAWRSDAVNQDDQGIFVRRFTAAGAPLGPPLKVGDPGFVADVAVAPAGDFVVVWRNSLALVARRYDASGMALGAELPVNSSSLVYINSPAVAWSSGGFVVAWSSETGILGRRFDTAGVPLGGEFVVSSLGGYYTDVAAAPSGEFVVAWERTYGYPSTHVLARRYDAAGVPSGPEFEVPVTTTGVANPSVGVDASGAFVVTWDGRPTPSLGRQIFARRFDASGTALGGDVQVNTFTTGVSDKSAVATDATGGFVVLWNSIVPGVQSVRGQRFDSAGVPDGTEFLIYAETPYLSLPVDVATGPGGRFVAAWEARQAFPSTARSQEVLVRLGSSSCGDGALQTPEQCDDGGAADGDGCSAACVVESCWTCSGAPSSCTPVGACGNGDGCCFAGCEATNDDDCPLHITGRRLAIYDPATIGYRRRLVFMTKDPRISTALGSGMDPSTDGASLQVYNASGVGDVACFELVPVGSATWSVRGGDPATPLLVYKDNKQVNGACRMARIANGRQLKVVCKADTFLPFSYSLDEPSQGSIAVRFRSGDTEYCTVFGGTVTYDLSMSLFNARSAPAPAVCPTPPSPCP